MEDFEIHQQMHQQINQEHIWRQMQEGSKPARGGRSGWVIVLAFALIGLGLLLGIRANAQDLHFADKNVARKALKAGDRNGDGILSREEADSLTVLNLTPYRIDLFEVSTYEDLARFPNLKEVWLGESSLKEVDLSRNPKLEVIGIQSPDLKTLTIAVGCTPKFLFPTRSGEVTIRRVVNPDDPNSIWYQ